MSSVPIYIVSKGRARHQYTSRSLTEMNQQHFVVAEPDECELYRNHATDCASILPLEMRYKDDYDTFDDLGLTKSTGPGPARNFVWDHSSNAGCKWHWVMDDNIDGFFRLNHNLKTPAKTAQIFRAMESFCQRFTNVAMGGPNYFMFASRKSYMPPYLKNTRIYSCNLIRNAAPFRWRGRYNEDTDLSLRMLKGGWCTIQFNAFLQLKMPTQRLPGGNTGEFYDKEGTLPKSKMIADMHPDVARVAYRFRRWHHYVNYTRWRNVPLELEPDIKIPDCIDNFGMVLQQKFDGVWRNVPRPVHENTSPYFQED